MVKKKITMIVATVAIALCPSASEQEVIIGHGTAVIAIFGAYGIVVAADGRSVTNSGKTEDRNTPKITVCNGAFLCGTAGVDPIQVTSKDHKTAINYHFNAWVKAIDKTANSALSVEEYAKLVRNQARWDFFGKQAAITDGGYWKTVTQDTRGFVKYAVIGYTNGVPIYCSIDITINVQERRLHDPELSCHAPRLGDAESITTIAFAGDMELNAMSNERGTNEQVELYRIMARNQAPAQALFPDALPQLRRYIAHSAASIELQGERHPDSIGGMTSVGVITSGHIPVIKPWPESQ